MMNHHLSLPTARVLAAVLGTLAFGSSAGAEETSTKSEIPEKVRSAVFLAKNDAGQGTAFACRYREREFVATNLHVASGTEGLRVTTQGGDVIPLGRQMILAEDADICLIAVAKPFSEFGITPLEFASNVSEDTKVGDKVYCLGNSLGNGVIIQANGTIKAFGSPRIETTTPFVGGNSGGPLIHAESQKVIGLITETSENRGAEANTDRDERAIESRDSELGEISYFGHRIDAVRKWSGTSAKSFLINEKALAKHDKSLECLLRFLLNHAGWREDRELVKIWDEYSDFIEEAKERTSSSVKVTNYVNEYGAVVRTDIRRRSKSVSQADYDKAYRSFIRGIEWKIQGDVAGLKKLKGLGYIQVQRRSDLEEVAKKIKTYVEDFKEE